MISKAAEGIANKRKLTKISPIDRNKEDVIEDRKRYAQWLMAADAIQEAVFIDGTNSTPAIRPRTTEPLLHNTERKAGQARR